LFFSRRKTDGKKENNTPPGTGYALRKKAYELSLNLSRGGESAERRAEKREPNTKERALPDLATSKKKSLPKKRLWTSKGKREGRK